jgi:hypothetical protein
MMPNMVSLRRSVLLLVALGIGGVLSEAQTTFERTYGGTKGDYAYSVQQTSDGGYIAAGYTYSFGAGSSDVYFIKTNSTGDTVWTRTYGGPSFDEGRCIQQASDGGYIISGSTSFQEGDGGYAYLIKTDSSGDTLWTRAYGGPCGDQGNSVRQTLDGGYIIAGRRCLIKTNSFGDTLWTRATGGQLASVRQTSDGGYIAVGDTGWSVSSLVWFTEVYLVKTDSSGNTLWTRTSGVPNSVTSGESVQQTSDGGYIVAGWTNIWGGNGPDVYVVKTSAAGDTIWTKIYGGPRNEQSYSVQQTSNGGYIIAGLTSTMDGASRVYLVKTNGSGDTLWTRTYGGPKSNGCGYSVQQTSDGGYIIAGYAAPFGGGGASVYLIKTGTDGLVSVENHHSILPAAYALQQNYPNPFNPLTIINYTVAGTRDQGPGLSVKLTVYDVLGREVAVLVNERKLPGQYEVPFDGTRLSSGVYFCRMEAGSFVKTVSLLLLK